MAGLNLVSVVPLRGLPMRRMLLLVATASLTAGCAGAQGLGSSRSGTAAPPPLLHVTPGSQIAAAELVSPTVGWALTAGRLAVTSNGGLTWATITPPGVRAASIRAVTAIGSNGLRLVVSPQSFGPDASTYTAYASDDSGRTWASTPIRITSSPDRLGSLFLNFSGSLHGWLTVDRGSHGPFSYADLYRTSDGGSTWTGPIQLPQSAPVEFVADGKTGFSAGGAAARGAYVSHDSGVSWQPFSLAAPAPYQEADLDTPHFVGATDGVMPALFRDADGNFPAFGFYVTVDGGRTWSLATTHANPEPRSGRLTFGSYDMDNLAATLPLPPSPIGDIAPGQRIAVTHDRGKSWNESGQVLSGAAQEFSFATTVAGWAVVNEAGCRSGKTDCFSDTGLFATHDGGQTWQQLSVS